MRIFLAFIFAILAIPCAIAQENSIDSLASQMADAINHAKAKTVAVFDFVGPDNKMTALGQKLADDLSAALAKSSSAFGVEDRTKIHEALERNYLASSVLNDLDIAQRFARSLEIQAFVIGKLALKDSSLSIEATLVRVKSGSRIKRLRVISPLTQEMRALMDKTIDEDLYANLHVAGVNGYSYPSCLYCPPAEYGPKATANKAQGTVTLIVVVGIDGRAHDIRVAKASGYDLDEEALRAVRSWRFKPATGPDGKPVAVRQIIEVAFHMY